MGGFTIYDLLFIWVFYYFGYFGKYGSGAWVRGKTEFSPPIGSCTRNGGIMIYYLFGYLDILIFWIFCSAKLRCFLIFCNGNFRQKHGFFYQWVSCNKKNVYICSRDDPRGIFIPQKLIEIQLAEVTILFTFHYSLFTFHYSHSSSNHDKTQRWLSR